MSVFNLALARPNFTPGRRVQRGCARTSTPAGQQYIKLVVDRGAGNIANMWARSAPGVDRQRPYIRRRGCAAPRSDMTTGTGLPGKHENLADKGIVGDPITLVNQAVVGGSSRRRSTSALQEMAQRLRS